MKHRRVLVALAIVTLGGGVAAQPSPNFSGRWHLVSSEGGSGVADALIVSQRAQPTVIVIERDAATGVQIERYEIGSPATGLRPDANWMGAALVLKAPVGPAERLSGVASRQETWSIEGDGLLHLIVTDRAPNGAESATRFRYRRVVPEAARPSQNLIDNADADLGGRHWLAVGDARVEACDGDPCFVVRNHGSFQQQVQLPSDAAGAFLAIVGSGASERVNADGAITGLPYLYGLVAIADGTRFLQYLQGQNLLARPTQPNSWVTLSGIFRIPDGAVWVVFDLNQAARAGVPQNGSAARFDRVGLYVFPSEADARAFVTGWTGRK